MPVRIVIKKYENRRLYDTSNSRYINLEDIAQMVRDGADLQVVDAVSGEDLTRQVLTQIIAENAKGADSAFPVDILRHMVIASGQVGQDGLLGYMKAMSDMYQTTYRAFTGNPPPFDFSSHSAGPSGTAPDLAHPSVEELRRRVEELERTMGKAAKKGSSKKESGKSKSKRSKR